MLNRKRFLIALSALIIICFLFCEYLIYYLTFWRCSWPIQNVDYLKVLLISDPHLLGIRTGHWFDKYRREWQMHRSFQTALQLFKPESIFILGDVFDEGWWATSANEYRSYLRRFQQVFLSSAAPVYVVAGNHDVGFHDTMVALPERLAWFSESFGSAPVQQVLLKGVLFVMVNSMALQRDGCKFCVAAQTQLQQINASLQCALSPSSAKGCSNRSMKDYSAPILMQHFPLFRHSDRFCAEPDEAPLDQKFVEMQPGVDCLTEQGTHFLLEVLQPRLAFSGHSHHGCTTEHRRPARLLEHTLSSFSWRNKDNPGFVLAQFSPAGHRLSKCYVPRESTVIKLYCSTALLVLLCALWFSCCSPANHRLQLRKLR